MKLIPHPSAVPGAIRAISVDLQRQGSGLLLRYVVDGDVAALVVPPPAEPVRADELWRTTCFELFVHGDGLAYGEFNFSPSGQWAAYGFDGYRSGPRELEVTAPPHIALERSAERLSLTVELAIRPAADARIGLSAVIEERAGDICYWALAHPPGAPDFHHDSCFAGRLPAMAAQP